ncbi:MAG: hypothetical protein IJE43_02295 [Alphaproteobacteria bacterium]|nr:hypothetical protein [Alphaproteobacteria bacterium]
MDINDKSESLVEVVIEQGKTGIQVGTKVKIVNGDGRQLPTVKRIEVRDGDIY